MKSLHVVAALALIAGSAHVAAGQTATQDVTITVSAVDEISVSASTVSITVGVGTVHNTATTYSVTTNSSTARVITGQITSGGNLPTGVTLTVSLAAPTGGTSLGAVTLTDAAADLVTGVSNVAATGKQIDYAASATVAAAAGPLSARTVTFTIQ
jgi:hypothetical protein